MSRVWGKCSMEGKHQPLQLLLLWGAWTAGEVPTHEDIGKPSTHHRLLSCPLWPLSRAAALSCHGLGCVGCEGSDTGSTDVAVGCLCLEVGWRQRDSSSQDGFRKCPPDVWVQVGSCANTVSSRCLVCTDQHRAAWVYCKRQCSMCSANCSQYLCSLSPLWWWDFKPSFSRADCYHRHSWHISGLKNTRDLPNTTPTFPPHSCILNLTVTHCSGLSLSTLSHKRSQTWCRSSQNLRSRISADLSPSLTSNPVWAFRQLSV